MSRIFIDRPIFAWVLAIIVMLGGIGAISGLPIEQYPDIAPPQVNIRATYPGASAETIENSVTQVHRAAADRDRRAALFQLARPARAAASTSRVDLREGHRPRHRPGPGPEQGPAGDLAPAAAGAAAGRPRHQVEPRLPDGGRRSTTRPTRAPTGRLRLSGVEHPGPAVARRRRRRRQRVRLAARDAHLAQSPAAGRVPADAQRRHLGDPGQNTEVAAGEVGGLPAPPGQMLNATVTAQSKLQTPEQFGDIVLKTLTDGSTVRIRRRRAGRDRRGKLQRSSAYNGHPGAGIADIAVARRRRAEDRRAGQGEDGQQLATNLPDGLSYAYANDSTDFIKLSVNEVVKTLIEAIILVVIVMFVFLQNWRATLIPASPCRSCCSGTFAVFYIVRLLDQHADAVRPGARDRPAGRRRHRRGRECRAADGRKSRHDAARGDHRIDARNPGRAGRHRDGACRRCSCRWPSSAARPA